MEIKTFFPQDLLGNSIASVTATLWVAGTSSIASGIKSETGAALGNPWSVSGGKLAFQAPNGDYDLRISGGGREVVIRTRFIDVSEAQAAAEAARAAAATARDAAGAFKSQAESASTNASTASASATAARDAALSAKTAAEEAASQSETWLSGAVDARNDAIDAAAQVQASIGGAQDAEDAAVAAKQAAELAKAAAEAAKTRAEAMRTDAMVAKSLAESARDVALIGSKLYDDLTIGQSATPVGQYFSVISPEPDGFIDVYKRTGPFTSELVKSYPSVEAFFDLLNHNAAPDAHADIRQSLVNHSAATYAHADIRKSLVDHSAATYAHADIRKSLVDHNVDYLAHNNIIVAVDGYGPGSANASVLAALSEAANGGTALLARSVVLNRVPTLGMLVANMRSGKKVKIACYGDSTTDGNTTTGHTFNPTSGGVPVGAIDHESTAPNAWPAKLKGILRKMYGNDNIQVWNAGYSGRRMNDGWALTNYDKAVTYNPAYGVPDVCFIGFGLNDITLTDAYIDHYTQTLALCLKLIGAGTLPILLTCAPTQRNDPALRDSEEATQEIDSAKRAVARQLSIPLFEVGAAMRQWASCNNGGYTWANSQPDDLHFGDAGHAFQAGFIAAQTYPDLIVPKDGMTIAAQDPRWQLNRTLTWGKYTKSGGEIGGRNFYSNNVGAGVELMSGWVWNEDPTMDIHTLVVAGGGLASQPNAASLLVEDTVSGVTKTVRLSGGPATNIQRTTDLPLSQLGVPVGLLRISTATPVDAGTGGKHSADLLFTSGRSDMGHIDGLRIPSTIAADSSNFRYYAPKLARNDLEVGDSCRIEVTADLPMSSGFVLWHCVGFLYSSTSYTGGLNRHGLQLYRTPSPGEFRLNVAIGNSTGATALGFTTLATIPAASVIANADESFTFVFELTWAAGAPSLAVKSASGTLLATVDLTNIDAPFSGWIGGLLYLADAVRAPVLRSISWSPL